LDKVVEEKAVMCQTEPLELHMVLVVVVQGLMALQPTTQAAMATKVLFALRSITNENSHS
jgi:hypothetical protein